MTAGARAPPTAPNPANLQRLITPIAIAHLCAMNTPVRKTADPNAQHSRIGRASIDFISPSSPSWCGKASGGTCVARPPASHGAWCGQFEYRICRGAGVCRRACDEVCARGLPSTVRRVHRGLPWIGAACPGSRIDRRGLLSRGQHRAAVGIPKAIYMDFIRTTAPLHIEFLLLRGLLMRAAACEPHAAQSLLNQEHRHA